MFNNRPVSKLDKLGSVGFTFLARKLGSEESPVVCLFVHLLPSSIDRVPILPLHEPTCRPRHRVLLRRRTARGMNQTAAGSGHGSAGYSKQVQAPWVHTHSTMPAGSRPVSNGPRGGSSAFLATGRWPQKRLEGTSEATTTAKRLTASDSKSPFSVAKSLLPTAPPSKESPRAQPKITVDATDFLQAPALLVPPVPFGSPPRVKDLPPVPPSWFATPTELGVSSEAPQGVASENPTSPTQTLKM